MGVSQVRRRMRHAGKRVIILAVLLLADMLRAWRLDFQELRGDEAFGFFFSQRSYAGIVEATLALKEPHPVGSYFIQHAWLQLSGQSEFALRYVSLWCGVAGVALIYRLSRRLGLASSTAIGAALLLAASPYAIWHSQDARMYSMSLALTLTSTWLAVEWWQRQRWQWAAAYLVVSWLALHTHYFNAFVLTVQSLFVLSRALFWPNPRYTALRWVQLQAVLGLLYLPWLSQAGDILSGYSGNGDSPGLGEMLQRAMSVFAVGESTPAVQRTAWAILAGVLLLAGAVHLVRGGGGAGRTLWLLLLGCFVPLLATWYSAQDRPLFNERYLLVAAPPFYMLLATGMFGILERRVWTLPRTLWPAVTAPPRLQDARLAVHLVLSFFLLGGIVLSLQRHYTDPAYSKTRGWRELAESFHRYSAQFPQERVRLVQNYPDPTLWYYYTGPVAHVVLPPAPGDQTGAAAQVAELAAAGVQRLVVALQPAANWDDQQIAETVMAGRYHLVQEEQVGVWPLQIYALPPAQSELLSARFQNGVQLTSVAIQPGRLGPGDLLEVYLAWRGDERQLTGTEKVFVQLLNDAGMLVAQHDRPLDRSALDPALDVHTFYAILLPDPLPAGSYRLIAGLYDPSRPGAPRVPTVEENDFVEIGLFTVVDSG